MTPSSLPFPCSAALLLCCSLNLDNGIFLLVGLWLKSVTFSPINVTSRLVDSVRTFSQCALTASSAKKVCRGADAVVVEVVTRRTAFFLFSGDDLFGDCATSIHPSSPPTDGPPLIISPPPQEFPKRLIPAFCPCSLARSLARRPPLP